MDQIEINNIIERFKAGDESVFEQLVKSHKDLVYALALKMAQTIEDAEEIAQDSFVKAYKGLKNFKGQSKFSTWIYQITYFTAINNLRKHKIETNDSFDNVDQASDDNLFEKIESNDRIKYLNMAMAYLKPNERAIITLYHLDEHSIEEVAEIMKLSVSNVKVKVHRTRKKMYTILSHILQNELNSIR
ncbi:RNA polymerase sigma factor [Crocinitomix catalasitica]|uniref:RNA polymerase sigma factor n=1 Tax=Crocinitomix catalasitica TaxID=184607 RepID=UPI00047F9F66|nr:sigma-70 family RNA polymerase sigma factor [Crocinitomix catalasitica]